MGMRCVIAAGMVAFLASSCAGAFAEDRAVDGLWSRPGEDWGTFLGPESRGRSSVVGMPVPWPAAGPKVVWHEPLGEGYGPPAAAAGRLLVFDRLGDRMRLRCLHAETGRLLWEAGYASDYADTFGYDGGPRAGPVVSGGHVLTHGPEGRLRCHRLGDGVVEWDVDTASQYGVVRNFFGAATAPVVEDDLVLLPVGGSPPGSKPASPERLDLVRGLDSGVVAFDLATGRERWRASDELASYSTPVVATIGGQRRLLAWMRGSLLVIDPANGAVLGRFPHRAKELFSVNAASPVAIGSEVLLSETYGPGSVLLDVARGDPVPLWQDATRSGGRRTGGAHALRAHWATPVFDRGFCYGFSGRNAGDTSLVCMDWRTGGILWHERGLGRGGLVVVGEQLLVIGEFGDLVLVDATPEAYRERSRARLVDVASGEELLEPPCWAAPVVAHGYCYVRGKGRLVCLDLLAND